MISSESSTRHGGARVSDCPGWAARAGAGRVGRRVRSIGMAICGAVGLGLLVVPVSGAGAQMSNRPAAIGSAVPWSTPSPWDYVTTSAGLTGFYGLLTLNREVQRTPALGGILFDESVRDVLRVRSQAGRNTLGTMSDVMLYTLLLAPQLVDGPLAWGRHGTRGSELFVINLQAIGFAGVVTELSKLVVGRGRPYLRTCTDPVPDESCSDGAGDESMVSGHAVGAFTGAGLLCLHHMHADLLGNAAWDATMCASGVVVATTTALLRVAVDKHYATDVVIGAAVGFTLGYFLPKWLHYSQQGVGAAVAPMAGPRTFGLTIGGLL